MASRCLGRLSSSRVSAGSRRSRAEGTALSLLFRGREAKSRDVALCGGVGTNHHDVRLRSTRATTKTSARNRRLIPPKPRRSLAAPDGDEYRWMHDAQSEEVLQHLEHENRYAAAYLRPLRRRALELHRCMMKRQPLEEGEGGRSVPERLGDYLYYTRHDEGKGFPLYVRRPVEGTVNDEQVVFDLNEIEERGGLRDPASKGHDGDEGTGAEGRRHPPTPALGSMKLSSDQRMLACTIDIEGNDRSALAVFDLGGGDGSGKGRPSATASVTATVLREDEMWDDVVGVEWGSSWPAVPQVGTSGSGGGDSGDGSRCYELYYTVPDELRRPWQVRRVVLRPRTPAAAATATDDNDVSDICVDSSGGGGGGGGTSAGRARADGVVEDDRWVVDSSSDRIVMEERDDAFFADVGKTKDHAFIVINLHSKTSSEVHLLPSSSTTTTCRRASAADSAEKGVAVWSGRCDRDPVSPTLLRRRQPGVEYYVDHCGDAFYFVTNASSLSATDASTVGGGRSQGVAVPASLAAVGEYRLVRIRQPEGGASLEGVADAPWDPVPLAGAMVLSSRASRDGTAAQGVNGAGGEGGASDAAAMAMGGGKGVDAGGGTESAASSRGGTIQEMDLFREHCVLYESCPLTGAPRLKVVPITGKPKTSAPFAVSLPTFDNDGSGGGEVRESPWMAAGASSLRPGVNSWFEARTARFSVSSPTAPEDVYDVCLDSGALRLLKRTDVPGFPRFDGRNYRCRIMQVASRDGESVPLTVVHRKGLELDGSSRLLLHGYGSYGMTLPIDYHPSHACMLERGWVLAFAHVRGGGERGKAWHAAGRGSLKWNSFWDFEACAEHLVSEGFTAPSRMGVHVNSAGGLLAGVMANTRPDLFAAMVMKAPFLGVLSAMCDTSLPLTVHEFDEWGDPSSSEAVEAMIRSYCPYENVRRQAYPALLVTASVNDTRVNFWDPAKWVARVRQANTGSAPVLLLVSDTDGHHGPGNTLDGLRDSATEMAFLERHTATEPGG